MTAPERRLPPLVTVTVWLLGLGVPLALGILGIGLPQGPSDSWANRRRCGGAGGCVRMAQERSMTPTEPRLGLPRRVVLPAAPTGWGTP